MEHQIDFGRPEHIYFIGIGGISMSGLAEILLKEGFRISGSDMQRSALTETLEERGAKVFIGQRYENVTPDVDCVVYTAAIREDNPEFVAAKDLSLPMLTRAELLGQMMRAYRSSIAVSGTHGKTTTTSMLSHILLEAETDPTISVGGILPVIGSNVRIGARDTFLLEACEYTNSFLSFYPTVEIILNIEADHLDFFKDIDDIRNSFRLFVKRMPDDGTLIIDSRIRDYGEIVGDFKGRVITVSGEGADYTAEDVVFDSLAHPSFTLVKGGEKAGRIELSVPGEHNVGNALAAAAAAEAAGIPFGAVQRGLKAFTGAERRFEKKGEYNGAVIIDDYAHHPQEIEATLAAAARCPKERLWVVFQPHTYSRTKALLESFAGALKKADHVILADIYAAREKDTLGMSAALVAERVNAAGGNAEYVGGFDEIEAYLRKMLIPGDMCITMGAGDVYKIGERLAKG